MRRHIGDYTLFMTGIFRDYVDGLAVTGYYEHEGRRAYRFVAEVARAGARGRRPTLSPPRRSLRDYAGALTYARKVYFHGRTLRARGAWPGVPSSARSSAE